MRRRLWALLVLVTACNGAGNFGGNGQKQGASPSPAPATDPTTPGSDTGTGTGTDTGTSTTTTGRPPAAGAECELYSAAQFDAPGPHGCDDGCPSSSPASGAKFTATVSTTIFDATSDEVGAVSGIGAGPAKWCLRSTEGEGANSGTLRTGNDGAFQQKVPLFCGKQVLNLGWPGATADKPYVVTYALDRTDCAKGGLRLTLSWGAGANDLELHLIKKGGVINNTDGGTGDCTWTSCVQQRPDWGKPGDQSDDPQKDIDWLQDFGTENIYLTGVEATTYDVYVEYWATGGPTTAKLVFNAGGKTVTHEHAGFAQQQVWHAGTIDGATLTVTPKDEIVDCAANWSSGCQKKLP